MTTKQKIIASIWVPIVSMYLQIISAGLLNSAGINIKLTRVIQDLSALFILGGVLWVPSLIICLLIENNWIKNDMEKVPISKILRTETIICLFTLWLPIILLIQDPLIIIFSLIAILLSITARWGYLKWRKIC